MPSSPVPDVHYATTRDGVRIAYSRAGSGPPVVYVRAFNSHAQLWWATGWTSAYFRTLATRFELVLVDARGNGLSDVTTEIDLDGLVEDVRCVIDSAGLDAVTLYGQGFGSPVAIAFAGRHPERVARLLLYCAYARGREIFVTDTFIDTFRSMPDAAAAFMGRETYPDDEDLPTRLLSMESVHATPETAVAYFEFVRNVDVTPELSHVSAPVLVMQPDHNPQIRERLGRDVAEAISGAAYTVIPGGSYNPYARMSFEPTLEAIGRFTGAELVGASQPVTLLLTDMVDSTGMTQRVGEYVSRRLHEAHDAVVRAAARDHGGVVTKHTGDGMMLSFDRPEAAVACAVEIQRRCADRNRDAAEPLEVRVGVAVGEAYAHNGQPFTAAAQLVTRVAAEGRGGEIVVADPIPQLGVDAPFSDAQLVALKGFPEKVGLRRLLWSDADR